MALSGQQMEQLYKALRHAFDSASFKRMLKFRLDKDLDDIAPDGNMKDRVFAVIDAAEMEGWSARLINNAHEFNPDNPLLAEFVRGFGLSSVPAPDMLSAEEPLSETNLEKIIKDKSIFQDVSAFIAGLTQLEPRICRISYPVGGGNTTFGTGFLVGPDLLLTNDHVMHALKGGATSPDAVECLFDYKELPDGTKLAGTIFRLRNDAWLVDSSPWSEADLTQENDLPAADELDYALLRLAEKVGDNPIGENPEPGAKSRGWIELHKHPPQVATGDITFVLQHPDGAPQKLALGQVLNINQNGTRVRHDVSTIGGSSGSPCFTADLKLFGLHHAGDPNFKAKFNQAIPMGRIVDQLESNSVSSFWV